MARELKLGLNTGYWPSRPPGPPPGIEATIAEAERLGFDSMWTAEAYGSDVLTPLAWWGAKTERIRLGTAIVQMSARTPTATAMAPAAATAPYAAGRLAAGKLPATSATIAGMISTAPRPSKPDQPIISVVRFCDSAVVSDPAA